MFSLLIAIVSIALVAILAAATIYYLSDTSKDGMANAQAARFLTEGSQVIGALEVYKTANAGEMPSGTSDEIRDKLLEDSYLTNWPGAEWRFADDYLTRDDVTEQSCRAINKKLGVGDIMPSCSDSAYANVKVCCTLDTENTDPETP